MEINNDNLLEFKTRIQRLEKKVGVYNMIFTGLAASALIFAIAGARFKNEDANEIRTTGLTLVNRDGRAIAQLTPDSNGEPALFFENNNTGKMTAVVYRANNMMSFAGQLYNMKSKRDDNLALFGLAQNGTPGMWIDDFNVISSGNQGVGLRSHSSSLNIKLVGNFLNLR